MSKRFALAALALLTFLGPLPDAGAQGAPAAAAAAARRQKLAAQQAAAIASAKAAAAATAVATINRPAPTAPPTTVATPPTAVPTVTATPTTAPTSSTAPKSTATGAPTGSAAPATSGSAAPVKAAVHPDTTAIALDLEALRKSRPERRHAEFVDMQSRWGSLLSDARSADELKLHAQRFAYLQRIRALGAKDPAFVKSVDELITKEETRDSDALNALRSGALPTAAPAAPAPTAGATK